MLFGERRKDNDDSGGWSALLSHHLEECRERYGSYVERHDALIRQIAEMDMTRQKQLDAQTAKIWSLLWRATFGIIAAMALMIGGLVGWLHATGI